MRNRMSLFFIEFSGVVAFLTGGIKAISIYAVNIALIYLSLTYLSSKKKNDELSGLIQK